MQRFVILALLCLSACTATPKPEPLVPATLAQEAALHDPFQRVAVALLQSDGDEPREGFLKYLEPSVGVGIVGGAFRISFSADEATQVADFLESPTGRAGVAIFGDWLLTGKFLKNPVPAGLDATWETFRSTAAGIKLFTEVAVLYKNIAKEAIKVGGVLVQKAIISDIGKGTAMQLFGTLLKAGVFFK